MAGFFKKIINKVTNKAEIDWDDLEAELIASDLGTKLTMQIVDDLQALGRKVNANDVVDVTKQHIQEILPADAPALLPREDGLPHVILMVGVNGTGKTTSSAKLAYYLTQQGYSVMLAAADTFRAAAVEQLQVWADRLEVPLVTGAPNSDPSSVCFLAHKQAIEQKVDFLICDTAGRLHTRNNLMDELAKLERTVSKQDASAPHLKLIVVDATTGSNALQQAKQFDKAMKLDGLVITKLDGSGKGGIAVTIQQELQIPPRFVGLGEEPDQFKLFVKQEYVEEIL